MNTLANKENDFLSGCNMVSPVPTGYKLFLGFADSLKDKKISKTRLVEGSAKTLRFTAGQSLTVPPPVQVRENSVNLLSLSISLGTLYTIDSDVAGIRTYNPQHRTRAMLGSLSNHLDNGLY